MKKPKILLLDIETAPILAYVWQLWDQNVALNQIHTDWYVLSWSAKWVGSRTVMYDDQRKARRMEDDKRLLRGIWKLLNEADIVVAQNGKRFDQKKLNARFILNGFQPPSSYRLIDTMLIAKKHFGFTSNKLEYLAQKLGAPAKLSHKRFAGFELWRECLARNEAAWSEMEAYNKRDVVALEGVYEKLLPWTGTSFTAYTGEATCGCGSTRLQRRGFEYTQAGKFQRLQCQECGAWLRERTNLLDKKQKKKLLAPCA